MLKISKANRPKGVNFYYRDPSFKLGNANDYMVNSPNTKRYGLWQLVLDAKNIPYFLDRHKKETRFLVSPLFFLHARTELLEFSQERDKKIMLKSTPQHKGSGFIFVFLGLLYFIYLLLSGQSILSDYLAYETIYNNARIDAYEVIHNLQMYRLVTAQFLHVSYEHVLSNILYSSIFMILLARRIPYNFALLMCIISASVANLCNVLYNYPYHISVGFSITLFSAIGMLCSDIILRDFSKRKAFISVAVALAFLAFLGAGEKPIDYSAHSFGLLCGFLCGLLCINRIDILVHKYSKVNLYAACVLLILICLSFSFTLD